MLLAATDDKPSAAVPMPGIDSHMFVVLSKSLAADPSVAGNFQAVGLDIPLVVDLMLLVDNRPIVVAKEPSAAEPMLINDSP